MAEVYDKGQILLPKYIRDALKITPRSHVNVRLEGNKAIIENTDAFLEEFEALISREKTSDAAVADKISKSKKKMEDEWLNVPGR